MCAICICVFFFFLRLCVCIPHLREIFDVTLARAADQKLSSIAKNATKDKESTSELRERKRDEVECVYHVFFLSTVRCVQLGGSSSYTIPMRLRYRGRDY